ncbi:MAG: DNA polymerase-3 subunit gamma/tau [Pelagibacterales bacterium]|nr:DNA polymerase-3 subunit gamma/tau [Pelagibacterales bacterium]
MEKIKHKVLALKYRPKNFSELIGQDIMVETITNSIKLDKLPNAYLFTGIRGVGKTTTARIVAKSLNCKNGISNLCRDVMCENCEGITNSNHLDVLEMDAASKTGIDDIRELIESSKYNPTSAKYKIIILDEVHMLSKQAFNGLLKTLEEPPPHLKFIFATTEIKKIPVTIISRCQRFDLNRVPIKNLLENLKKILKLEKGKVSEAALLLIAKAAEGSVRDSLSLLDRALISHSIEEKEIDDIFVRKMLGLADRSKILNLLDYIFKGNQIKSIEALKEMINDGIEPASFLNDFLEIIYFIQQKKTIGNFDVDLSISESEKEIINHISKNINMSSLIIFWQLVLKVLEELSIVSSPILSLEMLIVRLIYLKDIPSYENIMQSATSESLSLKDENLDSEINLTSNKKNILTTENETNNTSKNQIKNILQTKPIIETIKKDVHFEKILSIEDLISLSIKKRDIHLKYDLENNVNLIKFAQGKIDISFNENLDQNFVRNLSEKLLEWTGNRWVITLAKEKGQKTFSETRSIKIKEMINSEKESKTFKKFKDIFADGELLDVKKKD